MASLRDKLAPIYQPFVNELFDRPNVVEERATCDNCAMCDHGQGVNIAIDFFHRDAKCCTYYPTLPNFLIGGVFADPSPDLEEGRRRLRKIIAARIGVTPQWIAPPRKYSPISLAARSAAFGRSTVLRCPFYQVEGGLCTVWRYRENVCSTYYCKYTGGKPGWDFWQSLKGYLGHVEVMLSNYAVRTLDSSLQEPTHPRMQLTLEDLEDRAPRDEEYASYWGTWVGREEEFYVKCYEAASKIPKDAFEKFVDGEDKGRNFLNTLRVRWDEMNDRTFIPERLVRNSKMKDRYVDDSVVITSYNPYDSFKMDRDLFDVLSHFEEGRTVEENLAHLRDEHGAELEPALLQYLYTHGVLVKPGEDLTQKAAPVAPLPRPAAAAPLPAQTHARPKMTDGSSKKDRKKKRR